MTTARKPKPRSDSAKDPWEKEIMKVIASYLTRDEYKYSFIADECVELFIQGKNLTMRFLIYAHNRHIVVRVPSFIRNVELRNPDLLLTLFSIMNEFFDIRFELADDGQSLSASCNHIVEDGEVTESQFNQLLMVVAYLVDENYPRLMKIIYSQNPIATERVPFEHSGYEYENEDHDEPELVDDEDDESEDSEPFDFSNPDRDNGPQIN